MLWARIENKNVDKKDGLTLQLSTMLEVTDNDTILIELRWTLGDCNEITSVFKLAWKRACN